jgi:hypothetical protein
VNLLHRPQETVAEPLRTRYVYREMSDEPDLFAQRLLAAFLHLSVLQQEHIQREMQVRGIKGGIKAGIAKLVGIRTPSLLSDMLAGRVRGERYRGKIAELLGVSEGWLLGDDTDPPDWAMQPGEAYQRLCRRWRRAWAQRCGHPTLQPLDPSEEEDDSSSNRMWMSWLRDEERKFHSQTEERHDVARALALDPESREADWLAAGRYERVSFDLLMRYHVWLALPPVTHPDVARGGHRTVQIALAHQEWLTATIENRIERYALPETLFHATRHALREQRMQGIDRGDDTTLIEDTLELLWRQHLRRKYNFKHPPPTTDFTKNNERIT